MEGVRRRTVVQVVVRPYQRRWCQLAPLSPPARSPTRKAETARLGAQLVQLPHGGLELQEGVLEAAGKGARQPDRRPRTRRLRQHEPVLRAPDQRCPLVVGVAGRHAPAAAGTAVL